MIDSAITLAIIIEVHDNPTATQTQLQRVAHGATAYMVRQAIEQLHEQGALTRQRVGRNVVYELDYTYRIVDDFTIQDLIDNHERKTRRHR